MSTDPSLITGKVSSYTRGAAKIFANDVEGFADNRIVGQGELNADGTFIIQLEKIPADDVLSVLTSSNGCEGVQTDKVDIRLYTGAGLYVQQDGQIIGVVVQTSLTTPPNSDVPTVGEDFIVYWYASDLLKITGTCNSNNTTYNLDLKQGWNAVAFGFVSATQAKLSTTLPTQKLQWLFVPVSTTISSR
jgi:hypothetical protein